MAASMNVNSPISSKLSTAAFLRKNENLKKESSVINFNEISRSSGITHRQSFDEQRSGGDSRFVCTPFIVEFRRLLQRPKYNNVEIIPGVANQDLLHAAIALYDYCLPDITPEVLYSTVCEKWATSLLLVRSCEDAAKDYKSAKTTRSDEHSPLSTDHAVTRSTGIDLFSLEYQRINGDFTDPVVRTRPPSQDRDINSNTERPYCNPKRLLCAESVCRTVENSAVDVTPTVDGLGKSGDVPDDHKRRPHMRDKTERFHSSLKGSLPEESLGSACRTEEGKSAVSVTPPVNGQRKCGGDVHESSHDMKEEPTSTEEVLVMGQKQDSENPIDDPVERLKQYQDFEEQEDDPVQKLNQCQDEGGECLEGDSRISPEGEVSSESEEGRGNLCVLDGSGEKKDEARGKLAEVFSDTESEDSSSSEEEDEDFSEGADLFLKLVKERREGRQKALENGDDVMPFVGIESRLVGCATWERSHVCPGEATVQIDLLAVRRRYRKSGVGKYLLERMKDPSVVSRYDALVVYADHSAVKFFSGHGFSDDIILNSKYSELADNWTNCTLMTYIPPFTGQSKFNQADESLDLRLMELEIQRWMLKSREAYQSQMSCLMRMQHEIIALKALVSSQKDEISSLTGKIGQLQAEKQDLERRNLFQRIVALKSGIDLDAKLDESDTGYHEWDECEGGEEGATLDSSSIINDLERRLQHLGAESDGGEEAIDWTIAEEFALAMRGDSPTKTNLSVLRTQEAHPTQHTVFLHMDWCQKLNDPAMKTRMFFTGGLTHPERISSILENGFSSLDFTSGEYGKGLYFSQHPSTAAHFSALGKIVLAEVAIGRAETITLEDRTRTAPSRGYDSIITKGRLSVDDGTAPEIRTQQQEYVIFHPSQALPLCLIEYKMDR